MEHGPEQLTGLAFVAVVALLCGIAMQRVKQPAVMGYIVAGVVLGPSGFALVENREVIEAMAELGVLMLLFLIGMELSLRGFKEVWKIAAGATLLQIAVSTLVMLGVGVILDWPIALGLLLGFVVAISSTAIAIKILEETGELRTRTGQIAVGILIAQDLAVVPMMLTINSFGGEESFGLEAVLKIALSIGFLVLLILYLSRRQRLKLPLASWVGRSQDLVPLAGLAFCFGAAALSGLLGLSAAYGAFLAGLVIGNSTSRPAMIRTMHPIQSILLMAFFVSIGLLVDLAYLWDNLLAVLLLLAFVTLFKTALNIGLVRALGETWPRAAQSGVVIAQIGEFSFILAGLGLSVGVLTPGLHSLIIATTVLSLLFSPLWQETARRLHRAALLGITSLREMLRVTYGSEIAALRRATRTETSMVDIASSTTRWIGEVMPKQGRGGKFRGPPPSGPHS